MKNALSLRGAQFATKQSPHRELGIASQKTLAMTLFSSLILPPSFEI